MPAATNAMTTTSTRPTTHGATACGTAAFVFAAAATTDRCPAAALRRSAFVPRRAHSGALGVVARDAPRAAARASLVAKLHRQDIDHDLKKKYTNLDLGDTTFVEYIWLGGKVAVPYPDGTIKCDDPSDIRSKTKMLRRLPKSVHDLPRWSYDGSSTGQAPGSDSEVTLVPRAMYRDPFRPGRGVLALCDTYGPDGQALPSNTRCPCAQVMERVAELEPMFGMEQEYACMDLDGEMLGWPKGGYPKGDGSFYCGLGADRNFGRELSDAHAHACLYAGINLSGTNAEVAMSQWEFQVCEHGIDAADALWVARYILQRMSEEFDVIVTLEPKPMAGVNGAGLHTNFSTKPMREQGGYESIILPAINRLKAAHMEHISVYGIGNEKRLTGGYETAPWDCFSWGVADRGASVRVPRDTVRNGNGYLEDRRPASNADPYVLTAKLVETTCLAMEKV